VGADVFWIALEVMARSLVISGFAIILASLWGLPIAVRMATGEFRGRAFLESLFNSLVSIPTVVLGLALFLLFSRIGPLGFLKILYTPYAIGVGQAILITPLFVSLALNTLREAKRRVWELALSLGASRVQAAATLVREARPSLIGVSLLAFNRAIGELGVALMLGGNIVGFTRVMTTAIALEVAKGEYELALTLGGGLLLVTYAVTALTRQLGVHE
jgi:tungstate transport system permease protein